jgi:hypothetical protein
MLGAGTWMDPVTWSGTWDFLRHALQLDDLLGLTVVVGALWLLGRRAGRLHLRTTSLKHLHLLAGLGGLLALPLVLATIAWTVQPVLLERYALPALGGVALVVAILLSRCPRLLVVAAIVLTADGAARQFNRVLPRTENFVSVMGRLGLQLEARNSNEPVIFEARHDLYPLLVYFPQMQSRMYFLDFEAAQESPGTLAGPLNFMLFERDAQRGMEKHYPEIQSWPKARLGEWPSFTFVPFGNARFDPARIAARFPGWQIEPIGERFFHLVRPASRVASPPAPGRTTG